VSMSRVEFLGGVGGLFGLLAPAGVFLGGSLGGGPAGGLNSRLGLALASSMDMRGLDKAAAGREFKVPADRFSGDGVVLGACVLGGGVGGDEDGGEG